MLLQRLSDHVWSRLGRRVRQLALPATLLTVSCLGLSSASAQDVYYTGPATETNWTATAGMWLNGASGGGFGVPANNGVGYGADVNAQNNSGGYVVIDTDTNPGGPNTAGEVTWQYTSGANNQWSNVGGRNQPPQVGTGESITEVRAGGHLSVREELAVGAWGGPNSSQATFVQSGGLVETGYGNAQGSGFFVGRGGTGADQGPAIGTYILSGGTLMARNSGPDQWSGEGKWNYIGEQRGGTGNFILSGTGVASFGARTHVGFANQTNPDSDIINNTGTYTGGGTVIQDGDTLFEVRNSELIIGDGDDGNGNAALAGGHGEYYISGGTLRAKTNIIVGHWVSSQAKLQIDGGRVESGSPALGGGGSFLVGNGNGNTAKPAHGLVVQTAGSVLANGALEIGVSNGSIGKYENTGGDIDARANVIVGNAGIGTLDLTGGNNVIQGDLIIANQGTSSGTMHLGGTAFLDMTGGTVSMGTGAGSFTFDGGTLHNAAVVNFGFAQMGGQIEPGAGLGTTTINGDYRLSAGSHEFELGGLASHDLIAVNGVGSLDADANAADTKLIVELTGGHVPVYGNIYDVLTASGGRTGQYAMTDFSLAPLGPGLSWQVNYLPNGVQLQVVPEPSTIGLATVALAAAGLIARRRRRAK